MHTNSTSNFHPRRGSTLVLMSVTLMGLMGLGAALCLSARAHYLAGRSARESLHADYVCQAGFAQALYELRRGNSGSVGSAESPAALGESTFWVQATAPASDLVRLVSVGRDDRAAASMELVLRSAPTTIFRFATFGAESLSIDSNSRVDSYDSANGTYASQAVSGSGSSAYAGSEGDIGSNGDIVLDQNSKVWGNATAGPSQSTVILGSATVSGSTAPAAAQVMLPPIVVPSYTSFGALSVTGTSTTIPASSRTYSNLQVGANARLNITGPADIVITNLTLRPGSQIRVDGTNGPVRLLVLDNFIMNANTQIASTAFHAGDVKIELTSDNVINPEVAVTLDTVEFDSNSKVYGTIYAPSAAISFESNFELFGSLVARSVDIDSNSRIHFDESLLDGGGTGAYLYETISWRKLPTP